MGFLQTSKFYLKTFVAVNVFFGCAIYGVVASIVLTLIGKQHLCQWATARAFYGSFSRILGIKIEVLNEERLVNNLPGILIGNHQSTLDILILGRIFPKGCTVTSKRSLQWIPFLGWFMTLSGTFFLDRSNREKSIKTLNDALSKLKSQSRSLWIFPEGTRSYTKELTLGAFKKGAFHLAVDSQLPIFPIVVSNTSNLINFKEKIFNSGTILINCLDQIPTEGLTKEDVGKLTEEARSKMLEEVEALGYSKVGVAKTNGSDDDDNASVKSGTEVTALLD
ncbi:1-acylglycerol-3-phosphate O-acyltransferase [Saccharomycopsis crataegensis]|uniref:1-acyl-sn-glycerol-3-phosphate acyltransferase n=1 Tax=Saccharomycopsis crataegensis TaxID=43959 RepID=A0AAV5QDR7_9ASCO|nr:1-acylglycerol-3-phosphate O-acyltransferase [Saccharomycopsis crataegensis]